MKRLIVLFFLVSVSLAAFSQGLLRPVPKDLFTSQVAIKAGNAYTTWLPRLNVGMDAVSYGRNPETKALEVTPLSAVVFGMSFLHYKSTPSGPFNDFGFNLAYLQLTNKVGSGVGLYGTYNTGQIGLLNVGVHYDFTLKQVFFDTGVTWHF